MSIKMLPGLRSTMNIPQPKITVDTSANIKQKTAEQEAKDLTLDALLYQKHGEGAIGASKQISSDISGKPAKPNLLDKRLQTVRTIAKKSGKSTPATLAYAKAEAKKLKVS